MRIRTYFSSLRSSTYTQSLPYLEQAKFDSNNDTAVLMMNLGGPNTREEITPFLVRFFQDTTVIRIPFGLGPHIAKFRGPAKINKQYEAIGGFSPLLKWTLMQGELMKKPADCGFLPAFRYGLPLQEDAIEYAFEKTEGRIKQFLLFSQYPQYSCSTGGNAIRNAIKVLQQYQKLYNDFSIKVVDQWHLNSGYIDSLASIIKEDIIQHQMKQEESVILFTAHSLPSKFVWEGEYYPYYIYESCQATINQLAKQGIDIKFNLSYQSKVGVNEWLQPKTEHSLMQLINNSKYKNIIICPMGFTSDHLETLYELDIQLLRQAQPHIDKNGKQLLRSRSLNTNPKFIETLGNLVSQGLQSNCKGNRARCVDCQFEECDIVNQHRL